MVQATCVHCRQAALIGKEPKMYRPMLPWLNAIFNKTRVLHIKPYWGHGAVHMRLKDNRLWPQENFKQANEVHEKYANKGTMIPPKPKKGDEVLMSTICQTFQKWPSNKTKVDDVFTGPFRVSRGMRTTDVPYSITSNDERVWQSSTSVSSNHIPPINGRKSAAAPSSSRLHRGGTGRCTSGEGFSNS